LDVFGNNQQVASLSDGAPGGGAIINSSLMASVLTISASGGSTTFSGAIQGGGTLGAISLVIGGSGIQVLSGSNTYTGPTAVNGGELVVDGSLLSPVTVNSGGTLAGIGSLSSVIINDGGHLAPGDSPGKLILSGTLAFMSGAKMDYELGTPADSDEILMGSGVLALAGQQFSDFNFAALAGFGDGTYMLIDAGSITGSLGADTSGSINGHSANIAIQGNDLVLTVVPEPGTIGLFLAGMLAVAGCGVRRIRLGVASRSA
jgi:fibronectin-binding autotransporter adhesin